MVKTISFLVVICGLSVIRVQAQEGIFADELSDKHLDSLNNLLPRWKDTTSSEYLTIALEIRKESRKYAMNHHVYTHIVRSSLHADQPDMAERYARELFPVFQLLHLNYHRMNRGIECRNICFILSNYYYEKGDIRRGNYFRKLTLTRFHARKCGTGKWGADYRLMLQLIGKYEEAGQKLKAKHWQWKAKRYYRRHLE